MTFTANIEFNRIGSVTGIDAHGRRTCYVNRTVTEWLFFHEVADVLGNTRPWTEDDHLIRQAIRIVIDAGASETIELEVMPIVFGHPLDELLEQLD